MDMSSPTTAAWCPIHHRDKLLMLCAAHSKVENEGKVQVMLSQNGNGTWTLSHPSSLISFVWYWVVCKRDLTIKAHTNTATHVHIHSVIHTWIHYRRMHVQILEHLHNQACIRTVAVTYTRTRTQSISRERVKHAHTLSIIVAGNQLPARCFHLTKPCRSGLWARTDLGVGRGGRERSGTTMSDKEMSLQDSPHPYIPDLTRWGRRGHGTFYEYVAKSSWFISSTYSHRVPGCCIQWPDFMKRCRGSLGRSGSLSRDQFLPTSSASIIVSQKNMLLSEKDLGHTRFGFSLA